MFQKTMVYQLRGVSNVVVYQDDITITEKNLKEHIITPKEVLYKSADLTLNREIWKIFQKIISYIGFSIDFDSLNKNTTRVFSVLSAPVTTNISEVRAFIGMVNYYSKLIDNYA